MKSALPLCLVFTACGTGFIEGPPSEGSEPLAVCTDHCDNGARDCSETGVDCGGECPACADPCAGHCGNGVPDCGEEDTDCGGECPACSDACAGHCGNGLVDCGETGTDCGGECPVCPDPCAGHCTNGINDCGEDEIDCGGECGACPDPCAGHCTNGVRDCGEEEIDCGSECGACPDPCAGHCSNDVRDCGETGVDCGGECNACPDPCAGHCSNGVVDCNEAGLDCGGPCPACAPSNGCSFPQGVPDPAYSYHSGTNSSVAAAVNLVMAELSGCNPGSDCPIGDTFTGQTWFATVSAELRALGFCAGQHIEGHTDEIAVSDSGCTGNWYGYHIFNYGGSKVVWNPGAQRDYWTIEPEYCD